MTKPTSVQTSVSSSLTEIRQSDQEIRAFEAGLYPYLDSAQSALLSDIGNKKALDDDLRNRIKDALKEYKQNFLAEHRDAALKESSVKQLSPEEKKKQEESKKA